MHAPCTSRGCCRASVDRRQTMANRVTDTKVFFLVRKETSTLLVLAALVELPESTHSKANRQPTTENGPQSWPAQQPTGINAPDEPFQIMDPRRSHNAAPQQGAARQQAASSGRRARSERSDLGRTSRLRKRERRRRAADAARQLGRPHRRRNGNGTSCAGTSATVPVVAIILAAATATATRPFSTVNGTR